MNDEEHTEGAWVFLSHSHLDLEKVRRIRNALEAEGHNPLMFFLKCLGDDSEIDDLIRREIEARTWFILCESPNARASRWVQDEVEIIKGLEGRVYEVIDLDDDLDTQVERVARLSKRATVFISYSRHDREVAEEIQAALLEQEFRVFLDVASLRPGENWIEAISEALAQAVRKGFVLLLLSPEALASELVQWEVTRAFEGQASSNRPSNIVPIIVRDRETTLSALLARPGIGLLNERVAFADLTAGERGEQIAELIKDLKTREME